MEKRTPACDFFRSEHEAPRAARLAGGAGAPGVGDAGGPSEAMRFTTEYFRRACSARTGF